MKVFFLPKAERCVTTHSILLLVKFTKHREFSLGISFLYLQVINQTWTQIADKDI